MGGTCESQYGFSREQVLGYANSLIQALDAVAEEKVGSDIERHSVKQVHHIHCLARRREFAHEFGSPLLKDFQVPHPVLHKHGPNHGPAIRPFLLVGGEDAVPEKGLPDLVKPWALPVLAKSGGENCLDVLWVTSEHEAAYPERRYLDSVGALWGAISKDGIVKLEELVAGLAQPSVDEKGYAYRLDVRKSSFGAVHATSFTYLRRDSSR